MMTTQQLLQAIAQQNAAMQRPITPYSAPIPNMLGEEKGGMDAEQALGLLGAMKGSGGGNSGFGIGQSTADSTKGFDASVFNGGTYGGGLGSGGTYSSGQPQPFATFEAAPITPSPVTTGGQFGTYGAADPTNPYAQVVMPAPKQYGQGYY